MRRDAYLHRRDAENTEKNSSLGLTRLSTVGAGQDAPPTIGCVSLIIKKLCVSMVGFLPLALVRFIVK